MGWTFDQEDDDEHEPRDDEERMMKRKRSETKEVEEEVAAAGAEAWCAKSSSCEGKGVKSGTMIKLEAKIGNSVSFRVGIRRLTKELRLVGLLLVGSWVDKNQ